MDKFLAKLEVPQEEEEAAIWKQTNWVSLCTSSNIQHARQTHTDKDCFPFSS